MAHIVSVADVCEFQAAQSAEALLERKEVRQRLARVEAIGECLEHGNAAVLGQAIEGLLRKYARDDSVNNSLEVFRYVANGFARAKPCCRMVEKHRRTAEARNAHFKGHTGAKRRFFENHRYKFSFESAAIAIRPRFDFRRQVEEFAHLH